MKKGIEIGFEKIQKVKRLFKKCMLKNLLKLYKHRNNVKMDQKLLFQVVQDMDNYIKFHIGDANASFLREKLRFLNKTLPIGRAKTKTRGLLAYFSRWTKLKTWIKIVDLLKYLSENILGKSKLTSTPFIQTDRVVGPIDIMRYQRDRVNPKNDVKTEILFKT